MNSNQNLATVVIDGVRINADSYAAVRAAKADLPVVAMCEQHRAFEADNCPSCGTSRMSF